MTGVMLHVPSVCVRVPCSTLAWAWVASSPFHMATTSVAIAPGVHLSLLSSILFDLTSRMNRIRISVGAMLDLRGWRSFIDRADRAEQFDPLQSA